MGPELSWQSKRAARFVGLNTLTGLPDYQQGFVVFQFGQGLNNGVIALPVARRGNAAVHHQFVGFPTSGSRLFINMRSGASVSQLFGGKGGARARGHPADGIYLTTLCALIRDR